MECQPPIEEVIYKNEHILVCSKRFVINGKTYYFSGIHAVEIAVSDDGYREEALEKVGVALAWLIGLGAFVLFLHYVLKLPWFLLILGTGKALHQLDRDRVFALPPAIPTFKLVLTTPSGSITAFKSREEAVVRSMYDAINLAIVRT